MDPRFAACFLGGTALLVAGTALATGPLAAFAASPLAIFLAAVALEVWRGVTWFTPRHVVAAGVATIVVGLAFAALGPTGAGLASAVAGLGSVLCGTQLALAFDRPPAPQALPSPLGVALTAGVAADELLKLFWELGGRRRRDGDLRRVAREVLEAAQRNVERGWLEHPERAHPMPPVLEQPKLVSRTLRGAAPFEHLTFSSEYEPHDAEIHAEYLANEANRTAHVYLWRHRDGPRPTVLCIHGYAQGRIVLDAQAFEVRRLHERLGLDVAAVVLPLHGPRSALRRSGAGFLDGHPLWTNAGFTQAVWDLRRLTGWLRAQGAPALGVYGMSLGGYTSALFASLEAGLACAIPMIPVASLSALVWRGMREPQRHAAEAAGLSEEAFERAWGTHAPLRMQPLVPREGRLVVAALADRIVPPEQAHALWEHWERPALHWFPGTHVGWVGRRELRARIESHLRATLLPSHEAGKPALSRFR